MKQLIIIILLAACLDVAAQLNWDKANYNLFPDLMRFTITDGYDNVLKRTKKAEFDFVNELVAVTDSNQTFEVKGLSSMSPIFLVISVEPEIVKSELLSNPLNNKELLREYYRSSIYEDIKLNEISIVLRRGVIYTNDKASKQLAKSYKDKIVEGKLLWINPGQIWILEKDGTFISLSAFQIENIKMNNSTYNSMGVLYDAFFKGYKERSVGLNQKIITDLKNSSFEELILRLGAYSNVNIINGRTFIDWKYTFETYELNFSNKGSASSSSSGNYLESAYSNSYGRGYETSSGYMTPSLRSSYVDSYYRSNRQSNMYSSAFSNSISTTNSVSFTNGNIVKNTDEISIIVELGVNNNILNVIQNGVLTEPVYGLAFEFY